MGLKYIYREHGLTPNTSTGRCPYKLIKESKLPSMFPRLTAGSEERSQATAVSHSVARQRPKRTFVEGERVIVYDNRFKVSSAGKILEVLGNNTYLADCGKGPQHISGDCISSVPDVATRHVSGDDVQPEPDDDDGGGIVDNAQQDDNISVASDSSIGSDIIAAPDTGRRRNPAPVRRRRRGADQQLGPVYGGHRLRPRY